MAEEIKLFEQHKKIYPRDAWGRYRRLKWLAMGALLAIYYFTPWLRWDRGAHAPDQAILIDMPARRAYFFGIEIWPQEVYILVGLLVLAPRAVDELRRALTWANVAPDERVQRFTDLHDIGDMLVHAGFADPVMDMEVITLEYASVDALWRDLKAQAASNAMQTRPRGLMTPRKLRAIEAALDAGRRDGGPIRISVEVIYGHAWKVAPKKTADGHAVVRLDAIGRGKPPGAARSGV